MRDRAGPPLISVGQGGGLPDSSPMALRRSRSALGGRADFAERQYRSAELAAAALSDCPIEMLATWQAISSGSEGTPQRRESKSRIIRANGSTYSVGSMAANGCKVFSWDGSLDFS